MRGPKLNEGATVAQHRSGERHGTKATAKYVRSSASKARVVLDLVRGLDVRRADEVLQFTERAIAHDIRKVLASAVANASNPDNEGSYIADADELFVLACFADVGPTLRRFRPRARGRATRIRKRTCHITVVVARMSDQRLAIVQARSEGAGANAAASRRARVERSRRRTQAAAQDTATTDEVDETTPDEIDEIASDEVDEIASDEIDEIASDEIDDDAVETVDIDTVDIDTVDTEAEALAEVVEPVDADSETAEGSASAGDEPAIESGEFAPGEWPGSVLPDEDGNGPDTHPIKGNADSMLYHDTDSRYYKVTKAEVWFDTEEHAEAAGFSKPGTTTDDTTTENDED